MSLRNPKIEELTEMLVTVEKAVRNLPFSKRRILIEKKLNNLKLGFIDFAIADAKEVEEVGRE